MAIHLIALALLTLQTKSNDNFEEPSGIPDIAEPKIDHDINNIKRLPTEKTNTTNKQKSPKLKTTTKVAKQTITSTKRIKSAPLSYSGTLFGNIKSLSQSKGVKYGILVDMNSRKVLWSKNCKKSVPIASMTKMMTILLIMDDIAEGEITPSSQIRVTKKASQVGGSDVWLDPRETFPLNELLKAIVIKSANDAAYLVAENSGGGDISIFIKRMNKKAKDMGLKSAYFANPHGLPIRGGKDNAASCEDLVYVTDALLNYPSIVKLASTKLAYLPRKIGKVKKTQLLNTNKLVRKGVIGVDGMKTGYTNNAGSCIAITCKRNNRRLIAILAGCSSSKLRDSFAKKLLDWGYKK